MARNALTDSFKKAITSCPLGWPWNLLPKQIPYDNGKHYHSLRPGTMPTTVKLYHPILSAMLAIAEPNDTAPASDLPYRLVEKTVLSATGPAKQHIAEVGLTDGSSLVVTATSGTVRISHCETDGSHSAIMSFKNESATTLTAIMLALMPQIDEIDRNEGNSKLGSAADALHGLDISGWTSKTDIPEIVHDAFYYSDVALSIIMDKLNLDFGPATASAPEEIDAASFAAVDGFTGSLIREFLPNGWTPKYVQANGTAKRAVRKNMTIKDAKEKYKSYSADRNWSPIERMLIPDFPDDMPVMAETIRIADRICNTHNDTNPVVNIMWRGVTSYGKSTGVRQLAAILNIPLLVLTCHPGMEISEFKSTFVPKGTVDSVVLDMSTVAMPTASTEAVTRPPFFDDTLAYVSCLSDDDRKRLLTPSAFFLSAMMDTDFACSQLMGKVEAISAEDLCWLYSAICTEIQTAPLQRQIATLEAASANEQSTSNGPDFVHVISNYVKALVNGYIVEIQEASRIRDSGVLVGLNEFDRAGAMIPLMNGGMARRHKDAICIITDNVGYTSCRPIDPSVLRRQGMIIDSYELPREQLLDRVKRNTGCQDTALLNLGYNLWDCVKSFCEQNSIVEGSVSPTELERFIQAVYYDGPDSIAVNLDDCIISKASSSIEDQKEIRTACSTIYSAVPV